MTTGNILKALRGNEKQATIARDCGIARSTYNLYELDKRVPNDSIKVRLARRLGRSVQEIFFDKELYNVTRDEEETDDVSIDAQTY